MPRLVEAALLVCLSGTSLGCGGNAKSNGSAAGTQEGGMAGATLEAEASGGQGASQGGGSGAPAGASSAEGGGFAECGLAAEPGMAEPLGEQPAMIGLVGALGEAVVVEGVVESVVGAEMTIEENGSAFVFVWVEPNLADYFGPGEAVRLDARSPQISGTGYQLLTTVKSATATLATLDASAYTVLATQPGGQIGLDLPGLPQVRYAVLSCCGASEIMFACDYSQLIATVDDEELEIPFGEVGMLGGWSIGNWGSTYQRFGEHTWQVRATFVKAQD